MRYLCKRFQGGQMTFQKVTMGVRNCKKEKNIYKQKSITTTKEKGHSRWLD